MWTILSMLKLQEFPCPGKIYRNHRCEETVVGFLGQKFKFFWVEKVNEKVEKRKNNEKVGKWKK